MSDLKISEVLLRIVEDVEQLMEARDLITEDIKVSLGEAKSFGLDVSIVKKVIALRKLDPSVRVYKDETLAKYRSAVGL